MKCELSLEGCTGVCECYSALADANCCEHCAETFRDRCWDWRKSKKGGARLSNVEVGDKVKVVNAAHVKALRPFTDKVGRVCDVRSSSDAISVRFGDRENGDSVALFPGEYEVVEHMKRPIISNGGDMKDKKKGWRAKLAEIVELEDEPTEKESGVKILEDDGLSSDDFVILSGSEDGKTFKRLTFAPTTKREVLSKLESAKHGYAVYKLERDAKAETAARKSESKERTMKTTSKKSKKTAAKANGAGHHRMDVDALKTFVKGELAKNAKEYAEHTPYGKSALLLKKIRASGKSVSGKRLREVCASLLK